MSIGGLGDWFKKRLDDAGSVASATYHGVNPWDNGQGWTSQAPVHMATPQQFQPPQQDTRSLFSKTFDQVNPFDAGRTYQQMLPTQDNSSVLHQITHNGLTNTLGNLTTKPVVNTFNGFITEPLRQTVANATGNQVASQASDQRMMQDIHGSIPGFFADQIWNGGKLLYNTPQAVMADVHGFQGKAPTPQEQHALNSGLQAFEGTVLNPLTSPIQDQIDKHITGARAASQAAGYHTDASGAQKYFADPVTGAVSIVGLKGGVDAVRGTPAAQAAAANNARMMADQGGYIRVAGNKPPQEPAPEQVPQQPVPTTVKIAGPKERGFVTSVKNSPEVSPEVQGQIEGTYTPINAKARSAAAEDFANSNLDNATNSVMEALAKPEGTLTDQEVSNAIAVAKAYDAKGTEAGHNIATDIYEKLAPHGTVKGQGIQAFADLRNRTPDGMKFKVVRDLKKAGVKLSQEDQTTLDGLIDGIRQTAADSPERDMAIHNMVTFANKHMPSSAGDKIVNFWRAGLLSSPVTTGGNILGNATEAATRNLWTNPVASAADYLMSLKTGQRTKTMAGGQTKGVIIGGKKAGVYLKTGFDERNPITKLDAKHEISYGDSGFGKVLTNYVNGVYRWMGGQDQPFYYAARQQAVRDMAQADAKNLGLKGGQFDTYVKQAEADPHFHPQTFHTNQGALEAGKYAVYQNETALGHIAGFLKQPFKVGNKTFDGSFRQFLVPFSQVPASVATRIIDRTPIGIAKEAIEQFRNVKEGGQFDQRAMAEAVGNGTFAPGVIAVGYSLGKAGDITGNYPTDPKERQLWQLEGKQANSVKIGNRWYSLNYMQPFGVLLGIGAQAQADTKSGKSPEEVISSATGTAAKSVESQSFLQGIDGVLSAINDPQRSATQYVTTTASSLVPNLVRTTARATDPNQRDAKGLVAGVESAIPGVREATLPVKQDVFGRPVLGYDNAANQLLNPTRPSLVRNGGDPVTNELQRLQDANNGIMPTQYNKTTFAGSDGKGPKLTDQQVRNLQSQVGPQVYSAWHAIVTDPNYQNMSDENKASALKKAMDDISNIGKENYALNGSVKVASQPGVKLAGLSSDYVKNAQNDLALQKFKNSGDKTLTIGGTLYYKSKDGSVHSTPKVEYEFNQQDAKLNLEMDTAQAADNIGDWMKLAEQKYNALEQKKQLYDPQTEGDKIASITLEQQNLLQKVSKYKGYGGFTKGSRGAKGLPSIDVSIPSGLQGPVVSQASYTAPKLTLKNRGSVKIGSAKKVASVKINAPKKI